MFAVVIEGGKSHGKRLWSEAVKTLVSICLISEKQA
jgi:hypothetical protein